MKSNIGYKLRGKKGSGPAEVIIFAFVIVFVIVITVCVIEYFEPISKYGAMKDACRNTLYRMEVEGGLSSAERQNLITALTNMGLVVNSGKTTGTQSAKQGQDVTLHVEASYTYSKMNLLLSRSNVTENFVYDRTMCSEKVVN